MLGRTRAGCPCSSRVMAVVWELFLASLLTDWQSSGHNMYEFNSSYSSAGVFAVRRWVTYDAGVFYQFG